MREDEAGGQGGPAWWAQFLVGRPDAWGPAAASSALAVVLHDAVTAQTVLLVLATAALYWLGYSINDYCDAEMDAQDAHKAGLNVFARCPRPRQTLVAAAAIVYAGVLPIFGAFGLEGIAVFLVGNLAMWAYSAPPLRLKSRPGLDLLSHGLFVLTFPHFASLVLIDAAWSPSDWVALGICFFTSVAGQLRQQIRDYDVDVRTGVTFTTRVGPEVSLLAVKVLTLLTCLVFVGALLTGLLAPIAAPLGVLSFPAFIDRVTARRATRPPARAYNVFSITAAGYCIILMGAALF